jgi:hypothetical protein
MIALEWDNWHLSHQCGMQTVLYSRVQFFKPRSDRCMLMCTDCKKVVRISQISSFSNQLVGQRNLTCHRQRILWLWVERRMVVDTTASYSLLHFMVSASTLQIHISRKMLQFFSLNLLSNDFHIMDLLLWLTLSVFARCNKRGNKLLQKSSNSQSFEHL